ncbi:deoxycytidyl transferase [Loxospora ochrophaea]|nr:deoxycytidyl transferase [Loxospora ochrophaea]
MGSRLEENSSNVRKRIESHRFENEDGDEYGASKFGGFPEYFRRKKIKLQNLDAERRSSASGNPAIFRGVVAHVNGYTQPSLNDLHALIVEFGGGFMQYLDGKTTVTHIIASNLTPKKKVEFRRYRIVKPAWVVDSIKAGKLLPWDSYRVVDEGAGQQVLGFDSGNVVSQANSQRGGYKDQTQTSWYTGQLKSVANKFNLPKGRYDGLESVYSDHQFPLVNDEDSVKDGEKAHPQQGLFQGPRGSLKSVESHSSPKCDVASVDEISDLASSEQLPHSADRSHFSQPIVRTGGSSSETQLESTSDTVPPQPDLPRTNQIEPPSKKAKSRAEDHNAALLADPRIWKSTVVNPGFLKQYYEESRLHHLSTWKAELKSQLQALAAERSSQKQLPKRAPGSRRYILHVDFDSFFAAVSLRKHPQHVEKPVVVAHGGGSGSEIASCNYPARKFGIKNGMWMKSAQQLCPDITVLPYDFPAYEEASRKFYDAIMDIGGIVQSVSVDEALVDVSVSCVEAGGHDGKGVHEGSIGREQAKADEIAQGLRDQIKERTGCAVSVGIGGNILLAKVALRKAKPAGQYQIKLEEVLDFVGELTVQELPGVAYSIGGKLEEIGVRFVKDVRGLTKERLTATLGPKTGEKIWDYSRGIDRTEVGDQVIRKSVSAEINWGIRFVTQEQADEFICSLCEELHKRLVNEKVKGRQLTMKIMRRAADAPLDPPKHLGHGKCDTFNKSLVLGVATNDKDILGREALSILKGFGFSPGELRGIGVQMTKLEPLKGTLEKPLPSSQKRLQFKTPTSDDSAKPYREDPIVDAGESPERIKATTIHLTAAAIQHSVLQDSESSKRLNTMGTQFILPTQVDPDVLAELPEDIRSKMLPKKASTSPAGFVRSVTPPKPRSDSSAIPLDTFPTQSQLDQETLDALPPDLRSEVLGFYQKTNKTNDQSVLPQSPRKTRSIKPSSKKLTTPTKKRTGLLSRGRQAGVLDSNPTLTQSNFIATRPSTAKSEDPQSEATASEADEISPDFLSALPDDIRREVLAQQRRDRLKKRGGIDLLPNSKHPRQPPHPQSGQTATAGQSQRVLHLPARPPKPTFTTNKLTALPDLRDAIGAWFEEFNAEGPYSEDVEALVLYLQKVVGEEQDVAKAVAVAKWLGWVMEQGGVEEHEGGDGDGGPWQKALMRVQAGVQDAVTKRGMGRVEF